MEVLHKEMWNELFIDGLPIPAGDLIGEEGQGFRQILHGLNPERVLIAAEAVGIGRNALRRAADYANERVVFGRPIGQNQGVQHPLAASWAELEAANLMAMHAGAPPRKPRVHPSPAPSFAGVPLMALRRVDNVWSLKPTPPHPAWAACIQGVGPEHGWRTGTCEGACA